MGLQKEDTLFCFVITVYLFTKLTFLKLNKHVESMFINTITFLSFVEIDLTEVEEEVYNSKERL